MENEDVKKCKYNPLSLFRQVETHLALSLQMRLSDTMYWELQYLSLALSLSLASEIPSNMRNFTSLSLNV